MDESIAVRIFKDDVSLLLKEEKLLLCERLPMLDTLLNGKFSTTKNDQDEILIEYPVDGLELLCDITPFILKNKLIDPWSLEICTSLNQFLDYFSATSLRKTMADYIVRDLVFRLDESDWPVFLDLMFDLFSVNMLPQNWIHPRVEMSPTYWGVGHQHIEELPKIWKSSDMFHHLIHTKTFPSCNPLIWDRFRLHIISELSVLNKKPHFLTIDDTLWNDSIEAKSSLWTLDSQVQHKFHQSKYFGFYSNQTVLWDRFMNRVGDYGPFFQEWSDIISNKCKDPKFFSPKLINCLLDGNFQLCWAGGSIVSTLCDDVETSDIDLFVCGDNKILYSFEDVCLMLANSLWECIKSKWDQENSHFTVEGTVISIVCGSNVPNIQIIWLENRNSTNDVISGFDLDYTQCKLEMTKTGPRWSATSICLLALCTRQIRYYEKSRLSLCRLHKSIKKGFSLLYIPKELSMRMYSEISNKLDFSERSCPHRSEKLDSRKRKAEPDTDKDPIFCAKCFLDIVSRWTDVEMFLNIKYPETFPYEDDRLNSEMLQDIMYKPYLSLYRDVKDLRFSGDTYLKNTWLDYSTKISRLNEFTYDMIKFRFSLKKCLSAPVFMTTPNIWGNMSEIKFVYNLVSAFVVDVNLHNIYGSCKILLRNDNPNEVRLLGFLQHISRLHMAWKNEQNITVDQDLLHTNDEGNTVVDLDVLYISKLDAKIRSNSYADIFLIVDGGNKDHLGLRFAVLKMTAH